MGDFIISFSNFTHFLRSLLPRSQSDPWLIVFHQAKFLRDYIVHTEFHRKWQWWTKTASSLIPIRLKHSSIVHNDRNHFVMQSWKPFPTEYYYFFLLLCYIAWGVWIKLKCYDIEMNSKALQYQLSVVLFVRCVVMYYFSENPHKEV